MNDQPYGWEETVRRERARQKVAGHAIVIDVYDVFTCSCGKFTPMRCAAGQLPAALAAWDAHWRASTTTPDNGSPGA